MHTQLPIIQISLPIPWSPPGPVHVYLVREDPVTLIDTGLNTPESRAALLDGLKQAGLEVRDVRRILITHAHLDHMGQAAWLQEEAGAEVWMHPDEKGKALMPDWWNEGRQEAMNECGVPAEQRQAINELWQLTRKMVVPLRQWLPAAGGQRFEFASGALEALHLPGHALGHLGFWDAAGGRLLGGDHLLSGITPNPIMEPLPPGAPPGPAHAPGRALTLGQFLDSLQRVADMQVAQVLPSHGPLIDDHRSLAASYIQRHEQRLEALRDRLGEGITAFDLTRQVYPRTHGFDVFLAISEVVAHLDLLVVRGLAGVTSDQMPRRFFALR